MVQTDCADSVMLLVVVVAVGRGPAILQLLLVLGRPPSQDTWETVHQVFIHRF